MAITNIGSKNNGADTKELFQKIYKGEVEEAFESKPITAGLLLKKSITSGKSYEIKLSGKTGFTQQADGTELAGQGDIEFSNVIINVEDRITNVQTITEVDEKMNDFNERQVIKNTTAAALGNKYDYDRIREIIIGSRSANRIPSLPAGSEIVNADVSNSDIEVKGKALVDALFLASQKMAENEVDEEVYCILAPAEYAALSRNKDIISKDFNTDNGSFAKGTVLEVAGITILRSNNLKRVDSSADTLHGVDATNVYGVCFTMSSVVSVDLLGLDTRIVDKKDSYATKIMSSYVAGHKYLRTESCVTIVDAATE
jgi:hypothetical protein